MAAKSRRNLHILGSGILTVALIQLTFGPFAAAQNSGPGSASNLLEHTLSDDEDEEDERSTTSTSTTSNQGSDSGDSDSEKDTEKTTVPALSGQGTSSTADRENTNLAALPVTPPVKIDVNGDRQALKEDRHVSVKVSHANTIELFLQRPGSLAELFIGTAQRRDGDWRLQWNTRNTPNGEYQIVAQVTNIFGTYRATGPIVHVTNSSTRATRPVMSVAPLPAQLQSDIRQKVREADDADSSTTKPVTTLPTPTPAAQTPTLSPLPVETDSDGDGLSNAEEERLGTDPLNPDTDTDGFTDGIELARGYNPLKAAPGDKIIFADPRAGEGLTQTQVYKVAAITKEASGERDVIVITGQARPLTFVTLYIYSDLPTVVTTRTDEFGNFVYELDKTLEDGDHQVYIALTDSDGFIVEKSQPFAFVKTAEAVTVSDVAAQAVPQPATPTSPARTPNMVYTALAVVGIAVLVMVIMLTMVIRSAKQRPPQI